MSDSLFLQFHGAAKENDEYIDRGPISVNLDKILAYYDHTIMLADGVKIRVMETYDEIEEVLNDVQGDC